MSFELQLRFSGGGQRRGFGHHKWPCRYGTTKSLLDSHFMGQEHASACGNGTFIEADVLITNYLTMWWGEGGSNLKQVLQSIRLPRPIKRKSLIEYVLKTRSPSFLTVHGTIQSVPRFTYWAELILQEALPQTPESAVHSFNL